MGFSQMTRFKWASATLVAWVLSAALGASTVAHAAEPQASAQGDVALAETLFQMGKKLMEEEKYAQACDKFAESLRQDPGAGGTQLALAACHEKLGKTATAWAEYNTAASMARRDQRRGRLKYATDHLNKLEGTLSRLNVQVPTEVAAIAGVEVQRDGMSLPKAVWNVPVPVDPGQHVLRAQAPGYQTWEQTVTVGSRSDVQQIAVPPLVKLRHDTAAKSRAKRAGDTSTVRTQAPSAHPPPRQNVASPSPWPYVVGGAGLLAVGVGSFFGWGAVTSRNEVEDACPGNRCTSQSDIDKNDTAKTYATISTVSFAVGLVALGTSAVMLWPRHKPEKDNSSGNVRLVSSVGSRSGFVGLKGAW